MRSVPVRGKSSCHLPAVGALISANDIPRIRCPASQVHGILYGFVRRGGSTVVKAAQLRSPTAKATPASRAASMIAR